MEEKKMNEAAQKAGFENAVLIPVEDLVFNHEFRKFCEQNVLLQAFLGGCLRCGDR